jgi:hypothetical protein
MPVSGPSGDPRQSTGGAHWQQRPDTIGIPAPSCMHQNISAAFTHSQKLANGDLRLHAFDTSMRCRRPSAQNTHIYRWAVSETKRNTGLMNRIGLQL